MLAQVGLAPVSATRTQAPAPRTVCTAGDTSGDTLVEFGAFLGYGDSCGSDLGGAGAGGCADGRASRIRAQTSYATLLPARCVGDAMRHAEQGTCDMGSCLYVSETEACGAGTTCTSEGGTPICEAAEPLCVLDDAQNGNETDIDCGGSCPPCEDGRSCVEPDDCASSLCTDGICAAPSCSDRVQNGDEVGVDCGGDCGSASCELPLKHGLLHRCLRRRLLRGAT